MPNPTDTTNCNSACGHNSGPALRKNVHGHDAPPVLKQIHLYRTRLLLPHTLPRVPHAPEGEHASSWRMDLSRCSLLMGHPCGDRLQQRQALHRCTRIPGAENHVKHIHISGYNLHANGIVKHSHFDVLQALFKAADRDQGHWLQAAHPVLWSECVTPRRWMGCAPYYAVTGTHPLLPFDIIEANYLLWLLDSLLASTDLIAHCTVALQKRTEDLDRLRARVHQERNHAAVRFEHNHAANIKNYVIKRPPFWFLLLYSLLCLIM